MLNDDLLKIRVYKHWLACIIRLPQSSEVVKISADCPTV
ncbi:MAG: hypothetical protein ACI9D5_000869, partial [Candidatus Endobugula sp.]